MNILKVLVLSAFMICGLASANAERPREARYHAECATPTGVYDKDIYDYNEYSYGSYKITPLVGKKILFTNAFCVFTEY